MNITARTKVPVVSRGQVQEVAIRTILKQFGYDTSKHPDMQDPKVYEMFGLANIADGVEEGNDYPQLNAEYVVQANPSLIVLADSKCCGESADTVAARPGWDVIDAVKNGRVVVIDDDIASRWGPRLVDYIDEVASVLMKMTEG